VEYIWSTGSTATGLSGLAAGAYTVQITETNTKCLKKDVYTVTAPDALTIVSTIKNDACSKGAGHVLLVVSGGTPPYAYQWSNNTTDAGITGLAAGSYSVTVTDANTCRKDDVFPITDDTCNTPEVVIHDALTPNGDGVNDTWVIEGLDKFPDNFIQVFDKWGDLIFEEKNYNNTWVARGRDGTIVPDGTYFYLLKVYSDIFPGGKKVFTGSILIKR
jgi:gliding motility-associated-like protein